MTISDFETSERIDMQDSRPVDWDAPETETIDFYCSVFGCGRKLSLLETLCGDRCIRHQKFEEDIFLNVST